MRIGDELARLRRLEAPVGAALDLDCARGEDDAVRVVGPAVCDFVVERQPPIVELPELGLVLRARFQAVSTSTSTSTVVARARSASRIAGVSTAPPPSEITPGGVASASSTTRSSISRKRPSSNSRGIDPSVDSIRASTSRKGRWSRAATSRPNVVLPAPMKPTRAT